MRTNGGFTLIELLIVVAILAALASVAAPSFKEAVLTQRVKATSFDLIASLSFARSEAIKQNNSITLTPVSADWANGWTITQADGTVVQSHDSAADIAIAGPASIVYGRSGRVTTGTGNIEIDDDQSISTVEARCITLDPTGIPRAKRGTC